jgi:DNA-binding IclR family transcriptional regulator
MQASPAAAAPTQDGTVKRVLRILSCLAERSSWGLNELAREVDLPRNSVHRLLNLCKQSSFVAQDKESGRYMPGLEYYRIAAHLAADMPINRIAEPILRGIRDKTGETVMLTLLARNELARFVSLVVFPSHPMRYQIEQNMLQSLAWGAAGRVLLAHLTEEEIDEVIRREQAMPNDSQPGIEPGLHGALADIRRDGYSATYAQLVPESHGIAIPFFDADGDVRGSVSLAIPHFRFVSHKQDELIAVLRDAVDTLTHQLGWSR